jgi:hypothetical protein
MPEHYLPTARRAKLIVRELADEVVVYDAEAHKAYCLNRTAALVWKSCDGRTSVPGIARRLGAELAAPAAEDVVWLAVGRLTECGLVAPAAHRPGAGRPVSRRGVIRRLGLAAASLPLITTIVSPTPAEAQSPICTEDTQCPPGHACVAGQCVPNDL